MDGKQRLASLISFYLGSNALGGLNWGQAPTALEITDDTSCDIRWHGRTFKTLPEKRKRMFKQFSIQCVVVNSETDREVVFAIYQDINTGAVGHTLQQSRKAAFHGPYVEMLEQLAVDPFFLKIQQRTEPDSEKEYDRELALRFFAMRRSAGKFKTPLGRFLNQEIKDYQKASQDELSRMAREFKQTAETVWQIWGEQACRMPSSNSRTSTKSSDALNPALWDCTMVAVCEELQLSPKRRKELVNNAAAIREAYTQLLGDERFKKMLQTTSRANVMGRIREMQLMLQRVAPESLDKVRGFTRSDRQTLWAAAVSSAGANGGGAAGVVLCGICSQVIHTESDAEVDHIVPWSHGGPTTASNAQLVHRYCNRNKGNRVSQQQ